MDQFSSPSLSTPSSVSSLRQTPFTHHTVTDPTIFSTFLDQLDAQNLQAITHLTLAPSQHLGRITSLTSLGDVLGDSLGDRATYRELHTWIVLLQRLSHCATGLRSLTIIYNADMSGLDTHRYRRGVGECLAFIWAIGRFRALVWVDLQGYFPMQWPGYLRAVWNIAGWQTFIYNSRPAPAYLLWIWRQGTEMLDPTTHVVI